MAGLLPGVELARRRRTNYHYETNNPRFTTTSTKSSHDTHQHLELEPSSTTKDMDETTFKARKRLEHKLQGFVGVCSVAVKNIIKPSNGSLKSKTHVNSQGIKGTHPESSSST